MGGRRRVQEREEDETFNVDHVRHGERLRVDGTGRRLAPSVMADGTLARFKGGIGVTPVSSGVGTGATAEVVNRNIVRGVQPAGQIWVIRKLEAIVRANGDIEVEGEGWCWVAATISGGRRDRSCSLR
jgi:ferredoxin-NADP reductase